MPRIGELVSLALLVAATAGEVAAQAPGEVEGLGFADGAALVWDAEPGASGYNVYRGTIAGLAFDDPPRCRAYDLPAAGWSDAEPPEPGTGFAFVVTALSPAGEEGDPGGARALLGRCEPVLRSHLLSRAGFGEDEWTRGRIDALGFAGYVAEQLDPASIDESTNAALAAAIAPYDPPADIVELIARQILTSLHARRQLEQQATTFWSNHFNTYWAKLAQLYQTAYPQCPGPPQCDPDYPAIAYAEATLAQLREAEAFRALAFGGSFREILEASATSPAMILFLDTFANVAAAPNENYARELLELYAMGVDGGYTQADVESMARVLTGWTICKKKTNFADDPSAPCIPQYWEPLPEGRWVAHFEAGQHDCDAKTLFAGTPHEATIPASCATPAAGVDDLGLALDAIAAHPSTARFISRKLLERFVADQPDASLVDEIVAVWDDGSNPAGVGDLRAVLQAVLTHPSFLDPAGVRTKVKTPVEHLVGAMRAMRGETDGQSFVIDYLVKAQHIPFYNPVPTGWPENGGYWVDTTNTLERQNIGVYLTAFEPGTFGSDPIGLLQDAGVPTAPGFAPQIVDFFADVLFGGALDPSERQASIEFLETGVDGLPSPYDETRIRRLAGYMLGFPQFQEQ